MRRFALYLEKGQVVMLEAASERTGAPIAEMIRRAIDESFAGSRRRTQVRNRKRRTRK
jgi:hypothetical protein